MPCSAAASSTSDEPAARDVLGNDRQAIVGVALDRARPREPLVLEAGDDGHPLSERRLEGGQLRTQHQPLQHVPGFAIEREDTTAETVFVPGRRLRRLGIQGAGRHVHGAQQLCNGRTIMPFRALHQ